MIPYQGRRSCDGRHAYFGNFSPAQMVNAELTLDASDTKEIRENFI
jgi:hypothetical protein